MDYLQAVTTDPQGKYLYGFITDLQGNVIAELFDFMRAVQEHLKAKQEWEEFKGNYRGPLDLSDDVLSILQERAGMTPNTREGGERKKWETIGWIRRMMT